MKNQRNGTWTHDRKAWDQLTNDEKLDRLTEVFTRAGSDMAFRQRCMVSPREAISEAAAIDFPDDHSVDFLTEDQRLKIHHFLLPDYIPPQDGVAEIRDAEDYIPCSYTLWRG
jgi:hypothetical protein